MKKLLPFALVFLTVGCSTHKSKLKNHKLDTPPYELPSQQSGCGWVTVDETMSTKFLMLNLGTTSRQYNKSLYYCCPGESKPEPICYQTQWVKK